MRVLEFFGGSLEVPVPDHVPRNTITLGRRAAQRLDNLTWTVDLNAGNDPPMNTSTMLRFRAGALHHRQPPRAGGVLSTRFDCIEPTVACVILNRDDQGYVAYSPPSRYALCR